MAYLNQEITEFLSRHQTQPVQAPIPQKPRKAPAKKPTPVASVEQVPKQQVQKKNTRALSFTPYTMNDYQMSQLKNYVELGGLGSNQIGTDEWTKKQQDLARRKEYGRRVTQANTKNKPRAPPPAAPKTPSAREKALAFAKNVPKPRARPKLPEPVEQTENEAPEPFLDQLEEQRRAYQAKIDEIKSTLNI